MKILLDECIPRKFKNSLADHECLTVPEAGLAGKKNGELLSIAEHLGIHDLLDDGQRRRVRTESQAP
jgi:hypothetical protein